MYKGGSVQRKKCTDALKAKLKRVAGAFQIPPPLPPPPVATAQSAVLIRLLEGNNNAGRIKQYCANPMGKLAIRGTATGSAVHARSNVYRDLYFCIKDV